MTKRFFAYALAVAVMAAFSVQTGNSASAQDELPSAQDVITKYVEATGGIEAYQALKSLKMTGTLEIVGQGIGGEMSIVQVHPDKSAVNVNLAGLGNESSGYNGEHCWQMSMMAGNRLLEGAEAEELVLQSDFRRMYDPGSIYEEMTITGKESVDGTECYTMKMVRPSGAESVDYYSIESGLLEKSVSTSTTPMGDIQVVTTPSDYKEVGGVVMPYKMSQDMGAAVVEITFETIEVNGEIEDSAFAIPEAIEKLIEKKQESARAEAEAEAGGEGAAEPAAAGAGGDGG